MLIKHEMVQKKKMRWFKYLIKIKYFFWLKIEWIWHAYQRPSSKKNKGFNWHYGRLHKCDGTVSWHTPKQRTKNKDKRETFPHTPRLRTTRHSACPTRNPTALISEPSFHLSRASRPLSPKRSKFHQNQSHSTSDNWPSQWTSWNSHVLSCDWTRSVPYLLLR